MRNLWVLWSLVALIACKREDAGSTKPEAAPAADLSPIAFEWPSEKKFQIAGAPDKYGEIIIYQGTYQVTLHGFPERTQWSALDKKGTVESAVYAILKIADMSEKFGDLPADSDKLRGTKLDPAGTLELQLPSGQKGSVKLPPTDPGLSLEHVLKKVENGPVLFGNETTPPPGDKTVKSILFMRSVNSELFGRATVMRDVDAIATARQLAENKGTKKCGGYKDKSGKPTADIELSLKETEVTLYARRTGDVLQKKVFPPDDTCPMFAFTRANDKTQDSSVPARAVSDWLRAQIQR